MVPPRQALLRGERRPRLDPAHHGRGLPHGHGAHRVERDPRADGHVHRERVARPPRRRGGGVRHRARPRRARDTNDKNTHRPSQAQDARVVDPGALQPRGEVPAPEVRGARGARPTHRARGDRSVAQATEEEYRESRGGVPPRHNNRGSYSRRPSGTDSSALGTEDSREEGRRRAPLARVLARVHPPADRLGGVLLVGERLGGRPRRGEPRGVRAGDDAPLFVSRPGGNLALGKPLGRPRHHPARRVTRGGLALDAVRGVARRRGEDDGRAAGEEARAVGCGFGISPRTRTRTRRKKRRRRPRPPGGVAPARPSARGLRRGSRRSGRRLGRRQLRRRRRARGRPRWISRGVSRRVRRRTRRRRLVDRRRRRGARLRGSPRARAARARRHRAQARDADPVRAPRGRVAVLAEARDAAGVRGAGDGAREGEKGGAHTARGARDARNQAPPRRTSSEAGRAGRGRGRRGG